MVPWDLAADVGSRLRELRELLDWTQEDLGRELGRSRQSVLHWETGRGHPPRGRVEELCRRLHWPIEMFAEGGPRPRELLLARPGPSEGVRVDPRPGQGLDPTSARARVAEASGGLAAAGQQFGDPATWNEDQLLTVLERIEQTVQATIVGLDTAGIRQLQVVALREMIRAAKAEGRPVADLFYRVLYDLETA